MKHYLVIAGIALVVSLVVGYTLFNNKTTTVVNEDGTTTTVGANSGPDSYYPSENHNGVTSFFERVALSSGTTTPMSFKTGSATTTIDVFQCVTTNSTSTAQSFVLTKGTGMQASTTALSNVIAVAAGARGVVAASTTLQDAVRQIAPNSFIQFNSYGGVGTSNLTGFCTIRLTSF